MCTRAKISNICYTSHITDELRVVLRGAPCIRTVSRRPSHLTILFINSLKNDVCHIFFRFLLTVLSSMLSCFTPTQAIPQRTILITIRHFSFAIVVRMRCVWCVAVNLWLESCRRAFVRKYFSSILSDIEKKKKHTSSVFNAELWRFMANWWLGHHFRSLWKILLFIYWSNDIQAIREQLNSNTINKLENFYFERK